MSAKTILRNALANLLFRAHFTDPACSARGVFSIATFHRVLPAADRAAYPFPNLVVTPEELDEYLAYFTRNFDCGTLARQHKHFLSDRKATKPILAITFDDGQYDNYLHARPVLEKYGVTASFFVPVVAVERQELLWHDRLGFSVLALLSRKDGGQEQLTGLLNTFGLSTIGPRSVVENIVQAAKTLPLKTRLRLVSEVVIASGTVSGPNFARVMNFSEIGKLAAAGHEIGSHSMTHCLMPECSDSALTYELEESRKALEAHLSLQIESFCYPNGDCDERTAIAVARAGYQRAITTTWGHNEDTANAFRLRRFDIVAKHVRDTGGNFSPAVLAFRMSGSYPGLR